MIRSARRGWGLSIVAVLALAAWLSAAGVLASGSRWSASASVSTGPRHGGVERTELQRRLDEVVAAGAPGVVALVNDGRRGRRDDGGHGWGRDHGVWQGASGVADLGTRRPMRPDVRFRIGSVTKSFVATVALQLVAERRLALSDSVERWLPGVLPYGDRVTVRQLLNQTSGVPDYIVAALTGLYRGDRVRSWRPRELVALVAGLDQEFPAGSAWSYSNTNYVLAGMIIERVTGSNLGRELKRRIFGPLQLRDTYFPVDFPFLLWPHPSGYSLDYDDTGNPIEGRLLDFTVYNPSMAWAAGNIVADMDDIARFYRALLGGRLLPPAQMAELKTRVEIVPGVASYALGMFAFETDCGSIWGHSGGIPGFGNEFFSSEDGTRQYGLMINAETPPAAVYQPFVVASQQALAEAFGRPCMYASPSSGRQQVAPSVATLPRMAGRWSESGGSRW
jgi:D-alanyl-D-alanine carboxypeptidase